MAKKGLKTIIGQEYEIVVYDNKEIRENGKLDRKYSQLEEDCREFAEKFKKNYKGRLNLKLIIR